MPPRPAPAAAAPVPEVIDAAPPKKRGIVGRIVGLLLKGILAVLLVGLGFGAGFVYFGDPLSPMAAAIAQINGTAPDAEPEEEEPAEPMPQPVPRTSPAAEFVTTYYEFPEPMTTNLAGSRSFLQVGIGIATRYDAQVITNVQTHELALRSDALAVIGGFSAEDVATEEGRARLAAAIRDAMNRRLETLEGFGGIEDVFFPAFVLQ